MLFRSSQSLPPHPPSLLWSTPPSLKSPSANMRCVFAITVLAAVFSQVAAAPTPIDGALAQRAELDTRQNPPSWKRQNPQSWKREPEAQNPKPWKRQNPKPWRREASPQDPKPWKREPQNPKPWKREPQNPQSWKREAQNPKDWKREPQNPKPW